MDAIVVVQDGQGRDQQEKEEEDENDEGMEHKIMIVMAVQQRGRHSVGLFSGFLRRTAPPFL